MRPKNSQDIMILTKNVQGPGTYKSIQGIDSKGRYPISRFSNSCATLSNPLDLKDLTINNIVMMFQDLEIINQIMLVFKRQPILTLINWIYPISNLYSSKCRSFLHDIRKTYSVLSMQTLGPGQNRLPSDLGYYESKSATRN